MQRGNLVLIAVLVLGVIILIGSIANNSDSGVFNSPALGGRDSGNQNAPDDEDNGCPDVEGCNYPVSGGFSGITFDTEEEAMSAALERCENSRDKQISNCNVQIQRQSQICWAADCLAVTGPRNTGGDCKVTECARYSAGRYCVYNVDKNGNLIEPPECSNYDGDIRGWKCTASDGSVTQDISCIPTPGEGGSAGGGGGDN